MKETITFIGYGNMALSIAQGLKDIFDIEVVGRNMAKLDKFETNLGITIKKELYEDFDMSEKKVILCVKPANLEEVGVRLKGVANELFSVVLTGFQKKKLSRCDLSHVCSSIF